jgi:hypothetical protein
MTIRLRDLSQGALLHVVVALLGGPMKTEQIVIKTGKSHDTVERALAVLDAEFGLVTAVPDGRWPIWMLRDTSQLELPLPGLLGNLAVDNSPVSADNSTGLSTQIAYSTRSSSSLKDNINFKNLLLPVTTQIADSPECQAVINQLTQLGATPGQATKAIVAARQRNETLAAISQRIAALAQYAAGHHTIHNPGQWALGYVATGCALPTDLHAGADYSGYRPYLAAADEEADEAPGPGSPAL